jgi:hypothetical protein
MQLVLIKQGCMLQDVGAAATCLIKVPLGGVARIIVPLRYLFTVGFVGGRSYVPPLPAPLSTVGITTTYTKRNAY